MLGNVRLALFASYWRAGVPALVFGRRASPSAKEKVPRRARAPSPEADPALAFAGQKGLGPTA